MRPPNRDTNAIIIRLVTSPAESASILDLFEQVAADEGWQPQGALRLHAQNARHLAAYDGNTLLGGVQVVLPSPDQAPPYLTVWPDIALAKSSHTAHITVLAFQAPYRGRPALLWSVCSELWRFLVAENIEAVLLEATPVMYRRYCKLGFPLEIIGELRPHWGEACHLCRLDVRAVAGAMLMQAGKSPIYRSLIEQAVRPKRIAPRPEKHPV